MCSTATSSFGRGRELLSTHAKGDASQLLLQIVALLVCLGACFCLPVFSIGSANATAFGRLSFAWSVEHFLIATTMLVVGLFAVLSWGAIFPGQRDVLVLGAIADSSAHDPAREVRCRCHCPRCHRPRFACGGWADLAVGVERDLSWSRDPGAASNVPTARSLPSLRRIFRR